MDLKIGYTEDKQIGFEDWEMYANASMRGFQVDIVPESIYYRFSLGFHATHHGLFNQLAAVATIFEGVAKTMHSNLLKATFPRSSQSKRPGSRQHISKPSGMMAQGDARFHGIDEDAMIRDASSAREANLAPTLPTPWSRKLRPRRA